ncbi:unnamed protein product [Adineta steineri]|uniref:Uncharacterized protein n=2 Tax=Adineta steineri TaxID=433720 RepID=A0A813NNR4_9BILA|nr:unnamed protein product [Adineta steineri]CAF3510941.1 unnamed protein product [Adineta steineri]
MMMKINRRTTLTTTDRVSLKERRTVFYRHTRPEEWWIRIRTTTTPRIFANHNYDFSRFRTLDSESNRRKEDEWMDIQKLLATYSYTTSSRWTPRHHRFSRGGGDTKDTFLMIFVFFFFLSCIVQPVKYICKCNTEEIQTTVQPRRRPFDAQHRNSPPIQQRRSIRDTPLRNSTVSIEMQPSENNNSNVERATTSVEQQTSNLPPTYDSVVEESGVIIIIQQQSLLPPTYDAFMQGNNEREETDS